VVSARREDGGWSVEIEGEAGRERVRARLLVNAAGPWVDTVIVEALGRNGAHNVRLVKGSHIVTRRLYDHDRCYFFQNADGRPIFAIPYERDFTLIGTTDLDYEGDPEQARITDAETDYLLQAVSAYFARPLGRADIVWSYSGVRPLFDDGASASKEATRDYILKLDGEAGAAPLVNVFGGKLTTYRSLSQKVADMIGDAIGHKGKRWTEDAKLPGGDFPPTGYDALVTRLTADYPALEVELLRRLARAYGTRAWRLLGDAASTADLGQHFGADLYEREVEYLVSQEWAATADDILWRRSKLGLRIGSDDAARLAQHLASSTRAEAGRNRVGEAN
jgi:glycerol-3-phosphate dehydrogenase